MGFVVTFVQMRHSMDFKAEFCNIIEPGMTIDYVKICILIKLSVCVSVYQKNLTKTIKIRGRSDLKFYMFHIMECFHPYPVPLEAKTIR
jgi:hypothetical protein